MDQDITKQELSTLNYYEYRHAQPGSISTAPSGAYALKEKNATRTPTDSISTAPSGAYALKEKMQRAPQQAASAPPLQALMR